MPLPRFQSLAVGRLRAPFNHRDYFFEIKWDGFRCHARVEHGRCNLVSRNDNEFKSFSSLNAAIAQELENRSVVLDGEIVCLDSDGKPQFYDPCCSFILPHATVSARESGTKHKSRNYGTHRTHEKPDTGETTTTALPAAASDVLSHFRRCV